MLIANIRRNFGIPTPCNKGGAPSAVLEADIENTAYSEHIILERFAWNLHLVQAAASHETHKGYVKLIVRNYFKDV